MIEAANGDGALTALIDTLRALPQDVDDAVRIDRIRLLEEIKAAAAAAQVRETAALADAQRAAQRAAGTPNKQVGRGIAAQVALARRISPHLASRYVGWAANLTRELPATFAELETGRITEWRAMLVARETAWLSREHRAAADAELAPRLESLGDKRVEAEARRLAYRLDPRGYIDRLRSVEKDRRVSLRPAPDAMTRLTALLPVAEGVAAYAALAAAADTTVTEGDERSRGQIMADTLVERVTGQATAGDVPIAVNLIMTDMTLFAGDAEPAHVDGCGPVPAEVARRMVLEPGDSVPMWIRRLYTAPETGALVAMDSRQREFRGGQRHFVRVRDHDCRTNWCEGPIRHTDHVDPAAQGGETSIANGRGTCAACNYAKQAPGWRTVVTADPDGRHEVEIITPTGHRHRSRPPELPGRPSTPDRRGVLRFSSGGCPCRGSRPAPAAVTA